MLLHVYSSLQTVNPNPPIIIKIESTIITTTFVLKDIKLFPFPNTSNPALQKAEIE